MVVPYISERLNHRITNIFRKENIPVRVAHKSYTLRQALSHTSIECKCTRGKCPIANTGLCLRRNAVYQLTCNSCDQQYIGSTTRLIHDRVREQTERPQNLQRNSQTAGTEWSYLKISSISERLNRRITNIFRKENIPVRVAHKPYPTPLWSANAPEANVLSLTPDCVYEEMQCTSSRVTAAINIGIHW